MLRTGSLGKSESYTALAATRRAPGVLQRRGRIEWVHGYFHTHSHARALCLCEAAQALFRLSA
jgi:hypothetical protein